MGSKNGNRKHGRNLADCKRYAAEDRAAKSKARTLARHIVACPWDTCARSAFDRLSALARKGLDLPPFCKSPAQLRKDARTAASQAA